MYTTVSYDNLNQYLRNLPGNTKDTPYEIEINPIVSSFIPGGSSVIPSGTLRDVLSSNSYKYVSLKFEIPSDFNGDASYLINGRKTLVSIELSGMNNVTNTKKMFASCQNLVSADIGEISNVTDTSYMFDYCYSLASVNISDMTNVTDASYMFNYCQQLTSIDISDMTNVTDASYMFLQCANLTSVDASGMTNVTNTSYMFYACGNLTSVDVSGMTNVTNANNMFSLCESLASIDISDMANISDASSMFQICSSLEEIHGWSVPLTATMTDCFTGCTSLQAIYVPEVVPQESTWHAWDIKKDTANTRSDVTIYGTSGIPVTAQIPSDGTYSLEVSGMTDELLFSSTKAITSAHIQKMMQTQTPITGNTDALDPTKDNFVMLAKDRTAAKTNVTTDVVEAGNLLPPTSAAVHAAIDANKSGGIPLGGWTSFENDTAPNTEWLQAGTTFDSDTYPELFLYLGGNTVPERYDHSRLGDIESFNITTTNQEMQYDGYICLSYHSDFANRELYVNDARIAIASSGSSGRGNSFFIFVKKGDLVRRGSENWSSMNVYIRYYTHPLFIKATTTASSYTPSTAVQEIKDYTKDYVDAKNSYSTTEKLTGGTWIDGKPIYRKVVQVETFTTSNPLSVSIPNLDILIDVRLKRNYDSSHPTWWTFGDGTASTNNIIVTQSTDSISISPQSSNITIKNFTGMLEYTKTTD